MERPANIWYVHWHRSNQWFEVSVWDYKMAVSIADRIRELWGTVQIDSKPWVNTLT